MVGGRGAGGVGGVDGIGAVGAPAKDGLPMIASALAGFQVYIMIYSFLKQDGKRVISLVNPSDLKDDD